MVVGIEPADLLGLGLGEQPGQQGTAEVVDLGGDCVPVARVDAFLPLRRSHQNNLAAFTSARLLQFQQKLLAFQPARVSGQLTVASDHAMARDDDAQRVAADRLPDLLGRGAVGQRRGQFPVCHGLAVGDGGQ